MKNLSILVIVIAAMMAIGCTFSELFPLPSGRPSKDEPSHVPAEDAGEGELAAEPDEGDIEEYFPQGFSGIRYEDGVYAFSVNGVSYEYKDGDVDYFGHRDAIMMEIEGSAVTFTRDGCSPLVFRFR